MNTIVCPHCGQSNLSKSKLDYCSFCYHRFEDIKLNEADCEQTSNEQPNPEETIEAKIETAITEIKQLKGGHSTSICPSCHQDVPWEDRICPHCQFEIAEEWILQRIKFIRSQNKELEPKMPDLTPKQGGHATSICPSCRHNIPWEETLCPTCQFDLSRPWL